MNMAVYIFHLFFFALFSKKTLIYGAAVEAAYHVLEMKSLVPASTCSSSSPPSTEGLRGMQIVHRYGPCSHLGLENSSSSSDSHQMLMRDEARVRSMNSLTSNTVYYATAETPPPFVIKPFEPHKLTLFGRDIGAGNYVVQVRLGDPSRNYNLIFDTGSEITWLRCGSNGYRPSASSKSLNATCGSGLPCNFDVTYGDNSTASGYILSDLFFLTWTDLFNFYFGCALQVSTGFGSADGLLGVGQNGNLSLISQTSIDLDKIFCYCLPRSDSSTGYLLFGSQARKICQTNTSIGTTPLFSNPDRPSFYYVNLIGIIMGDQRLEISSKTILDSGTIITRLPTPVYSALRSEFVKSMSQYHPAEKNPPMDTCYDLGGYANVTVPKMVLQFENIQVNLDPSAVIYRANDSQVCLAFAGNDDVPDKIAIIGNHQQRTLNVLYDIPGKKVEFGIGDCAN